MSGTAPSWVERLRPGEFAAEPLVSAFARVNARNNRQACRPLPLIID
jgi:hypothetical protein